MKINFKHYLWHTWWNMIRRCYNEETRGYKNYGGNIVSRRLKRGWSEQDAITRKPRSYGKYYA